MNLTVEDSVRTLPELRRSRNIPAPADERPPLSVSVFERMGKANTQLVPLFPYTDTGTIVPCGAMMWGGPERDHGQFFHWNTVNEVTLTWGSKGGMLNSGHLVATQKYHGVNSFLKDEKNPEFYTLVVVTQRQSPEADQLEAMVGKCEGCRREMIRYEYYAGPRGAVDFDATRYGREDDLIPQFPTLMGSLQYADIRNSDEGRTCAECGHVNELLDTDVWGWPRAVEQTRRANSAYHAIIAAAAAADAKIAEEAGQ